jgi:hypothetical protein
VLAGRTATSKDVVKALMGVASKLIDARFVLRPPLLVGAEMTAVGRETSAPDVWYMRFLSNPVWTKSTEG